MRTGEEAGDMPSGGKGDKRKIAVNVSTLVKM